MIATKPLGIKNYGHIKHLPGSRIGPGDHKCNEGETAIATIKFPSSDYRVYIQEKLDGSNVGVARIGNELFALNRAGHIASSSPYEQHHLFDQFVKERTDEFMRLLKDGEHACGEWMVQAHGTKYLIADSPFFIFDIMKGQARVGFDEFHDRIMASRFEFPTVLHMGGPLCIEDGLAILGEHGFHGAIDLPEGLVYWVENNGRYCFKCKYVRPDKIDGKYLPSVSGQDAIWNWKG